MIPSQGDTKDFLQQSQYKVSPVQAHSHTGRDSLRVDYNDLNRTRIFIQASQGAQTAANFGTSHAVFVNDNISGNLRVKSVAVNYGTASTSGSLQISVSVGTQSLVQGTNQLSSNLSLFGTAHSTLYGSVIPVPTSITAGGRLNLVYSGDVSNLADCVVGIVLEKV